MSHILSLLEAEMTLSALSLRILSAASLETTDENTILWLNTRLKSIDSHQPSSHCHYGYHSTIHYLYTIITQSSSLILLGQVRVYGNASVQSENRGN